MMKLHQINLKIKIEIYFYRKKDQKKMYNLTKNFQIKAFLFSISKSRYSKFKSWILPHALMILVSCTHWTQN